ncbi:MAG TPA: hypothetical protein VG317_07905 [Pseudonocardiaceae bacterium]|nr:hypothetical protein [Pseudonocardiaceae bacterium]
MIIPTDYHEFFVAAAGASGALIGLLFVAVSIFPERARQAATRVEYHARASAALLLFSNAMVLSLAALVPGVDLGWWAVVISAMVLAFAAATARLIVTAARQGQGGWQSLGLVVALLAVAGFECYAGVRLIGDHTDTEPIETLNYVVIADLAVGIARAWQLVNMRETGLLSSLRVLALGDDPVRADAEPDPIDDQVLPNA